MSADRPTRGQVDAALERVNSNRPVTHATFDVLAAEVLALRAELDSYLMLTPQTCSAGKHPEWLIDSEHTHACPWCQIDALRAQVADMQAGGTRTEWAVGDPENCATDDDDVRQVYSPRGLTHTDRDYGRRLLVRTAYLSRWTLTEERAQ